MGALAGILGALPGIGNFAKIILGNREARDAAAANFDASVANEFGAEFGYRENRTWWDSLIDGINRIPRPFFAIGFGYIVLIWPAWDMVGFVDYMRAISVVPEGFWYVLLTVVFFFFGGRMQVEGKTFRMSKDQQTMAQTLISENKEEAKMDDDEYAKAMASPEPLSNEAILEWKRRQSRQ
jgi:hypothetical protein